MSRSKPKRTIELTYAEVTQTNDAGTLFPCLIGPRYVLHTVDNGSAVSALFKESELNINYDNVPYEAIVDYNNAVVKFADCVVEVTSEPLTVTEMVDNTIVFDQPVAGNKVDTKLKNNYSVRAGDKVRLTPSEGDAIDAMIIDVESVDAPIICEALNIADKSVMTKSMVFDTENVREGDRLAYSLQISEVKAAAEASPASVKMNISALFGDESGIISGVEVKVGESLVIGSKGLKISITDDFVAGVKATNVIVISVDAAPVMAQNKVVVNMDLTGYDAYSVSILSGNVVNYTYNISEAYYNTSAAGVAVESQVRVQHAGLMYKVVEATAYVEYRELKVEGANEVYRADSTGIAEFVGEISPDNPLAMMSYCANLAGTSSYYVIAVEDNSYEAYVKAIDTALKYENAFAPITYSQSADIISYLKSGQDYYNSPEMAQFKKLWLVDNTVKELEVWKNSESKDDKGNVSIVPLLVTIVGDTAIFHNGDLAASGVKKGDILVIPSAYDPETATYNNRRYKITSVNTKDKTVTVHSTYVSNIATPEIAKVVRQLSNTDYATIVGGKAAANDSPYINYIWADHPNCIGYGEIGLNYLAVTLAALRCVSAPHAPLSDVIIPGWTVGNSYGLNEDDLDIMNDKGVWVVYTDNYGYTVTRHQLTTAQDGTMAEEDSAVSNACNIIRSLRSMLYKYRGDATIQKDMLSAFHLDLTTSLMNIMKRSYPDKIGSQLLSYTIEKLEQDPDNKARMMLDCNLEVPEPFLEGNYKFNII